MYWLSRVSRSGHFSAKVYLALDRGLSALSITGGRSMGSMGTALDSDVDIGMYQKRERNANSDYTLSLKSLSEWKLR